MAESMQSDSELSELNDPTLGQSPSSFQSSAAEEIEGGNSPQSTSNESFGEDNDAVSEDADSDVDVPKRATTNGLAEGRSTSPEANTPFEVNEIDIHAQLRENPELYGIRRSSRNTLKRPMVKYTSDESEDSMSDVVNNGRKKRRRTTSAQKIASRIATPVTRATSTSVSEDEYSDSDHRPKRKGRRHTKATSEPSLAEQRFSTRRATKIANYNEDDDERLSDDDSDILTPNSLRAGVDETIPGVDVVLNHRLRKDTDSLQPDPRADDFEFFIKWQNKAHYHATWETTASLSGYRGIRRVDNYMKKIVAQDMRVRNDPDVPIEEKEQWLLDRERDADILRDYMKVERVIGSRDGEDGEEYLVKWKTLNYDHCTWEAAPLITSIAQEQVDRYIERTSQVNVSNKYETARRSFQIITQQPPYIKHGQLRDFQIYGLNWLATRWASKQNVILADEMGLGKTVQTVAFMNWLRHYQGQQGPFLIIVPLSTMPAWAETMDNWTPDINYVVYNGNEAARDTITTYEQNFHVVLTTYEYALGDTGFLSQMKWQLMVVDEAHRLKNPDSVLYKKLLAFRVLSCLLITGTPVQNNLKELKSLMDFANPGRVEIDENMDPNADDEIVKRKLANLHEAIRPYILRRTKRVVENDLPPKVEMILRVPLTDIQLEYYKNILTKNYAALNQGSKGNKQSLLNIMMELKKISNHPFLITGAEDRILQGNESRQDWLRVMIESSGKMQLLHVLLDRLKAQGHRVLIFSQMVAMLDLISEYLRTRGLQHQRLDGTVPASARRVSIDHFNAPDSTDFCFLLSTRAGGLGINLMTADTVILFDSDWNPQADLQAMARAHRIGQTKPVTIYRIVARDSVEEEVLERARNKRILEYLTIQRGVTDKEKEMLTQKGIKSGKIAEPTRSDDLSRILKRRGQKMFEQQGSQLKLEELDVDKFLAEGEEVFANEPDGEADGGDDFLKSFEYTDVNTDNLSWETIIPKEDLDKVKEEEKAEADKKYLAEVIEQERPRKRKAAGSEREQRALKKRARDKINAENVEASEEKLEVDPYKPLSEKEQRNLHKAFLRYGSIEDRGDELRRDAGLEDRDPDLLKAFLDELTRMSTNLLDEDRRKLEELQKEGKVITKKDKKAVLFDHKGIKRCNADTIIARPHEMKMIRRIISASPNPMDFRVLEATKPAHYSCEWAAKEDGMLCIGIDRHGYGAWVSIRDDPELCLTDKLFLEENRVEKKEERGKEKDKAAKSPGAVHLGRRADYLLSVLKELSSEGDNLAARKAVQNHHRNNKRNGVFQGRLEKTKSVSNSPAPFSRTSNSHKPAYMDRFGRLEGKQGSERKRGNTETGGTHSSTMRKNTEDSNDRDQRHTDVVSSKRPRTSSDGMKPADVSRNADIKTEHHKQNEHKRNETRPTDASHINGYSPHSNKRKHDGRDEESHHIKHRRSDETPGPNREVNSPVTNGQSKQVDSPARVKTERRPHIRKDKDDLLYALFKPVRANFDRLQEATKSSDPSGEPDRIRILKKQLVVIGDFAKTIWDENDPSPVIRSVGKRLWDFVACYWPDNGVPGTELKARYDRLVAAKSSHDSRNPTLSINRKHRPTHADSRR